MKAGVILPFGDARVADEGRVARPAGPSQAVARLLAPPAYGDSENGGYLSVTRTKA